MNKSIIISSIALILAIFALIAANADSGALGAQSHTNSGMVVNEDGTDDDSRIESDGQTHMFFVDAGNNRIGIASSTPMQTLSIGDGVGTSSMAVGKFCMSTVASDGDFQYVFFGSTGALATSSVSCH